MAIAIVPSVCCEGLRSIAMTQGSIVPSDSCQREGFIRCMCLSMVLLLSRPISPLSLCNESLELTPKSFGFVCEGDGSYVNGPCTAAVRLGKEPAW